MQRSRGSAIGFLTWICREAEIEEIEISRINLDAAITVHNEFSGPGLLESYYVNGDWLSPGAGRLPPSKVSASLRLRYSALKQTGRIVQ